MKCEPQTCKQIQEITGIRCLGILLIDNNLR